MLSARRLVPILLSSCFVLAAAMSLTTPPTALGAATGASAGGAYVQGQVVVGYRPEPVASVAKAVAKQMSFRAPATPAPSPSEQVLKLDRGVSVAHALSKLRHQAGVAYAVPNYIAHAAGSWYPNDPGRAHAPRGWTQVQWNFLPGVGVNAPGAWANLLAVHRPGGRGVTIAVLDTGVAFTTWHQFRKSPDFGRTRFVKPYDFVAKNRFPLDREGHGTFVAGTIAESTNNRIDLTGLAYGASIMPVRILDADGTGDAVTISRGIRYAAIHGAQVINLSLEFSIDVTSRDIPEILSAIRFAHSRGVVVVAAAGNEGVQELAYPARAPDVISVGATTRDRCLAIYSNYSSFSIPGTKLDLVAPGGGDDTAMLGDPGCNSDRMLPDITQLTLSDPSNPRRFGYPSGWYGTSMSAPHVAAAAGLVIASGVIGRHPTPDQVRNRLEQTAQTLGGSKPNQYYGYGLLDAGAATSRTTLAAQTRS
jgi:serine protease